MSSRLSNRIHASATLAFGFVFFLFLSTISFAEETRLVQLGDEITFGLTDISSSENVVTVKWRQTLMRRTHPYVQTAAAYEADGKSALFSLFIQKDMLQRVLDQCGDRSSETCQVTVNDDYQYGQNNAKTSRFLVYHDKSRKPYQHRFINTTTIAIFGKRAQKLVNFGAFVFGSLVPKLDAGVGAFNLLADSVGDNLHNF